MSIRMFSKSLVFIGLLAVLCITVEGKETRNVIEHKLEKRQNTVCADMGGVCRPLDRCEGWVLQGVTCNSDNRVCCVPPGDNTPCREVGGQCQDQNVEPCQEPFYRARPGLCSGPNYYQCCVDRCRSPAPYGNQGVCQEPSVSCTGRKIPQLCEGSTVCCCPLGVISHDPHLTTFDGHHYDFQGVCWYTILKVCIHGNYPDVNVIGLFQPRSLSSPELKTRTMTVKLTVGKDSITMNHDNSLHINNEDADAFNMTVVRTNGTITVRPHDVDMMVVWEGKTHSIFIKLDDNRYRGKVCGLLGNADGSTKNDFTKSDGELTDDINEFGESWRVPGTSCPPVNMYTEK